MYALNELSTAIPVGSQNVALVAGPPSPAKSPALLLLPVPARLLMVCCINVGTAVKLGLAVDGRNDGMAVV